MPGPAGDTPVRAFPGTTKPPTGVTLSGASWLVALAGNYLMCARGELNPHALSGTRT